MAHYEIYRPKQVSRWQRWSEAVRSFTLGPFSIKNPPRDGALARMFGGGSVSAGVAVNEQTAMNYSAVWAATNLISSHIGSVPLQLFKTSADGRGKDLFKTHPLYRILHDRPNSQMGSMVFRRTLQANALIWGNGYAEIERDEIGRPVALWPLLPFAVEPKIEGGRLRYKVHNPSEPPTMLDAADILHIRGLGDDGIQGYSVIGHARESIGLGIAAERFGATFFGNGSVFGGIISYPVGIGSNEQTRKENREALERRHQGVDKAHRFLALYEGAKYEQLGVPPNAAQFIETRAFQIEEICRWFNLPPHKLKHLDRSTNNNIEHQGIEYVTDTLDPWWVIWEEELEMKLIAPLERGIQIIEHNREGMLRGDSSARGELQSKQFSIAAVTPNEIRAMENRNPMPGGDRVFVPFNTIPLDRLDEWFDAEIEAKKAKTQPPPPQNNPNGDRAIAELEEKLALARHVTSLAEELRDKAQADLTAAEGRLVLFEAAHAATVEGLQREKAASDDALALANTSLHDAASRELVLTAERDQAQREGDACRAEILVLREARDGAEAERDTNKQAHDAAIASMQQTLTQAETVSAETAAALAQARQQLSATESVLKTERDEHGAAVDEALVERSSLQRVVQETTAQRESLRVELAETKQHRTGAELALETERQQTRARRAAVLASMRSLFVDASERLLQKESDRARKHQATTEKLRAWVDTFYPMHTETVRHAFRPIVGAWAAVTGGEPGELLERLVSEHIDGSKVALMHVLDADDEDMRAAVLEKTLRRWEDERADAMADALVREGMAGNA